MTTPQSVVLTDGGMGQELMRARQGPAPMLWSAQAMMDAPATVEAAHRAFVEAGARLLTVNAYAATRPRLMRSGLDARFEDLQRTACDLARAAARDAPHPVAVAGCLSPLEGSYIPERTPSFEAALAQYREICALQAPHVDLFIAETMAGAEEARAAAQAACETGRPVWVAWTLEDGGRAHLRSGDSVAAAAAALDGLPVDAVLVNCCHPESVDAAVPDLQALGRPWGAYANGFVDIHGIRATGTVDALVARPDLGPDAYAERAMAWVEAGATIVGGCCEVGPAHIAALAGRLEAAGISLAPALAPEPSAGP